MDTMTDIVRVVEESSTSGKNKAQLTVSPSGSREVHWRDWSEFFFKTIPNITTYHHFKVSKSEPGMVTVKEYVDSSEEKVNVFKKDVNESSLRGRQPTEITPSGLDANGTRMMKVDLFALIA